MSLRSARRQANIVHAVGTRLPITPQRCKTAASWFEMVSQVPRRDEEGRRGWERRGEILETGVHIMVKKGVFSWNCPSN